MEKQKTIWTQYEDNALKQLRINRKIQKWSQISKILVQEFFIKGKSGKRCRERFQNSLDQQVKKQGWTSQEQELLVKLHNQKGNKWAEISKILVRSDNSVKNHFHSKLRKAIRRINSKISLYFKSELKQIKNNIISKIIQTAEQIYSPQSRDSHKYAQGSLCYTLKNRILSQLQGGMYNLQQLQLKDLKDLVIKLNNFNKNFKRKSKKEIKSKCETHFNEIGFQKNSFLIKSLQKQYAKKQNSKENQCLNVRTQLIKEFSIKKPSQFVKQNDLNQEKSFIQYMSVAENDGTKNQYYSHIVNQDVIINNINSFYQTSYYYPNSIAYNLNLSFHEHFGYLIPFNNFYDQNLKFSCENHYFQVNQTSTQNLSYNQIDKTIEKYQMQQNNFKVNEQVKIQNKEGLDHCKEIKQNYICSQLKYVFAGTNLQQNNVTEQEQYTSKGKIQVKEIEIQKNIEILEILNYEKRNR